MSNTTSSAASDHHFLRSNCRQISLKITWTATRDYATVRVWIYSPLLSNLLVNCRPCLNTQLKKMLVFSTPVVRLFSTTVRRKQLYLLGFATGSRH